MAKVSSMGTLANSQPALSALPRRCRRWPANVAEHLFLDVGVGDELPAVAILVAEVEATAVVAVVDLHVVLRARAAAVLEACLFHAAEDGIEVLVRHQEGVVVALEVLAVVEVQREVLVDLHRGEVAEEAG